MRPKIHPKYFEVVATCACGETFKTRSTTADLRLEICSKCHPFFTGKQKLIDTAGRVERFKKRYRNVSVQQADVKKKGKAASKPAAAPPAGTDSGVAANSRQN